MENIKVKIVNEVLGKITNEITNFGYFCDSDNVEHGKEFLASSLLEELDLDLTTEEFDSLEKRVNDEVADYLNSNYKKVSEISASGNVKFYYFDRKYNFKNIKDLENFFNIGE